VPIFIDCGAPFRRSIIRIRSQFLQVILPDGQINHLICHSPVQPLREKYFASRLTQITFKTPAIPSHSEGRFAIVTDVGCGMRWTRQRQARANASRTNDVDAYGEVV
jgi:hypothetical protein